MTKRNLERRYKFLLLQLKKIHKAEQEYFEADTDIGARIMGRIGYMSDFKNIMNCIRTIEQLDEEYNFFNNDMTIDNEKGGSL